MPRGGYRPGSGPAKGTKYKPRVKKEDSVNKSLKSKTKKEKVPDLVKEAAEEITDVLIERESKDSLECLQNIFSNPLNPVPLRIQAAGLALQYQHARKGEGKGKKNEREENAKRAGQGKFSPAKPPLRMVK